MDSMDSLSTHTDFSLGEGALFTVIGQSLVDGYLSAHRGEDGEIVGFTGPGGNPIELCLAFEVEGEAAGYLYLSIDQQRPLLGFHEHPQFLEQHMTTGESS